MLYGNCISIKLEKNEVTEEGKLKQKIKKQESKFDVYL